MNNKQLQDAINKDLDFLCNRDTGAWLRQYQGEVYKVLLAHVTELMKIQSTRAGLLEAKVRGQS